MQFERRQAVACVQRAIAVRLKFPDDDLRQVMCVFDQQNRRHRSKSYSHPVCIPVYYTTRHPLYPHGCCLFRKIDNASNTSMAKPSKSRILSTPWRAVAPWIPGEHTPSRPPGLKNPVHMDPPTGVRIVSLRVGMPKLGSKLPQNQ